MRIFFEYNGEPLNKEQIEYIERQFGVKAIDVTEKETIEQVDILNKYLNEIAQ